MMRKQNRVASSKVLALCVLAAPALFASACSSHPNSSSSSSNGSAGGTLGGASGSSGTSGSSGSFDAGVGTVAGAITDLTGAPVSGATVSAGTASAMSGADGTYTLPNVAAGATAVVGFSAQGFLPMAQAIQVVPNQTAQRNVVMVAMADPLPLNAVTGGSVTGMRGATLSAGPNAFVNPASNNSLVTGMVQVFLRPLDPAVGQEATAYPGTLTSGNALLQSFGLLEVTVQQNGQSLQVAPGSTLTIQIPSTVAGGIPTSAGLYSFDTNTGIWDQEGSATLGGGFYTATLQHLCWHQVANGLIYAACFTGRVVYADGGLDLVDSVFSTHIGPMEQGSSTTVAGYPSQTLGNGAYCVWGAPGVESELSVTGKVGSIVAPNMELPFPNTTGAAFVGSCTVPTDPSSTTYTPPMPWPLCQTVPNIVVGKSSVRDGGAPVCTQPPPPDSGSGADAGPISDLTTSCAAPLLSLFQCLDASGGCAISVLPNNQADLNFGDGASITFNPIGTSGQSMISFYGPQGNLCGTGSTTLSNDIVFSVDGMGFDLSQTTITCLDASDAGPAGTVVPLSGDDIANLSGCGSLGGGPGGLCAVDAGTTGPPSCTEEVAGMIFQCTEYPASEASIFMTSCTEAMGTWGTGCSTDGQVGCCAIGVGAEVTTTCYYGVASEASAYESSCNEDMGVWTPAAGGSTTSSTGTTTGTTGTTGRTTGTSKGTSGGRGTTTGGKSASGGGTAGKSSGTGSTGSSLDTLTGLFSTSNNINVSVSGAFEGQYSPPDAGDPKGLIFWRGCAAFDKSAFPTSDPMTSVMGASDTAVLTFRLKQPGFPDAGAIVAQCSPDAGDGDPNVLLTLTNAHGKVTKYGYGPGASCQMVVEKAVLESADGGLYFAGGQMQGALVQIDLPDGGADGGADAGALTFWMTW